MRKSIDDTVIELVQGDITQEQTDAIVNAANSGLRGGGGVDGAIHRAGGPAIMAECRRIGGCPTGTAVITTGGELPARYVIHTVGPRWTGGDSGEAELLASAYRSSLQVAVDNGLKTVAFPSISTGVYGYPIQQASQIALRSVVEFLGDRPGSLDLVRFVLFSPGDYQLYRMALEDVCTA